MDVTRCEHGLFMYYSSTSLGRHYVWIIVYYFVKLQWLVRCKANTTIRSNEKENRTCCVDTTLILVSNTKVLFWKVLETVQVISLSVFIQYYLHILFHLSYILLIRFKLPQNTCLSHLAVFLEHMAACYLAVHTGMIWGTVMMWVWILQPNC